MKVESELKTYCLQWLCSYIDRANSYYRRRMPVPNLDFSLRGVTAGQMVAERITRSRSKYTIRLNGDLLQVHANYFVTEVLPHEVAHMVVDWVYGRRVKAHGSEWQSVMRDCFDLKPDRCHTLPVEPARRHKRDYIYRCGCQSHQFTARRHKNAQRGSSYICRSCNGALRYVGMAPS